MCNGICPNCKELVTIEECKYKNILDKKKEYYNKNKDKIKNKNKKYYDEHRDKMLEHMKKNREKKKYIRNESLNEKLECECGGRYTVRNQSTHHKTKRHINYINSSS